MLYLFYKFYYNSNIKNLKKKLYFKSFLIKLFYESYIIRVDVEWRTR